MHFKIQHTVRYQFSQPVFLEPHVLRFQPRVDGGQWLESFGLKVSPEPSGRTDQPDAEGNTISFAWFDGLHESLTIRSRARVQTLRQTPYDFLLPPVNAMDHPYRDDDRIRLEPVLRRDRTASTQDSVRELAVGLLDETDRQVFAFLESLTRDLHDRIELVHREHGEPFAPEETLRLGRGACRDIAVLFIDACRAVGLAARFTSGYHLGSDEENEHDLHAWAEAYIPNAGWRGFDPSSGLLASNCHIPVASSRCFRGTMPVSGTFRGTGVVSGMEADVQVTVLERGTLKV